MTPTGAALTAITGGHVLSGEDGAIAPADVIIDGGTIAGLAAPGALPPGPSVLDARGLLVAPGFVDTHVHGALGRNFMMAEREAIEAIGRFLSTHGVTSILAATASLPRDHTLAPLLRLARLRGRLTAGPEVLGIHLEGPFLSSDFRGVHRADAVRAPASDEVAELLDELDDALRLVTLAPERDGALAAVQALTDRGVVVSLGHSGASRAQARTAIDAGARRATHLFNAMPEQDGDSLVDEILDRPEVTVEIIADGFHVPPATIGSLYAQIGAARVAIVSDGSDVTGLADGPHTRWEGTAVVVADGASRTPDGTLAGSIHPLDDALRLLVREAHIPLNDALRSLSEVPARSIGASRKGAIRPGADADAVMLDQGLRVRATVAGGRLVHGG
ncbi:MAG TPA: amidohydrolase family protein [Gryllotalpicola sp.]